MKFLNEYSSIKSVVSDDLSLLEKSIEKLFAEKSAFDSKMLDFTMSSAKRLRPLLGFLYLRANKVKITKEVREIMLAVELIHNATLIHDDVIDNSETRRGKKTFNVEFDNNLAVVSGDFLLSVALERVLSTESVDIVRLFTSAMKDICEGEIYQYFSKFKVLTINEYIKKSEEKTALLFELAILAPLKFLNYNKNTLDLAKKFSKNFGIGFQIRDDLINFLETDLKNKSDFSEGIYTAPVIYAKNLGFDINDFSFEEKSSCVEKTKVLMDNYFDKALVALSDVEESVYKVAIVDIIDLLKKSVQNG
jgi:geranylgeranyl pyrophosphate synthase